ncbi:MAG: right-handed parallel beta-helix repeat-containing protein [Rickettsiales bacterium]|nr:right-handed parallel beta-helix repeat-containing protein [Rickettsiales bacterium]
MSLYNVKDFGAVGNGVTNDTHSIQQAIDAAYENGGGLVYIPKGTYIVSGHGQASKGAIQVKSNVTLTGEGMGETIIKLEDGSDEKVTGIIRTPSGEITENVGILSLSIDGNQDNTTGEVDGIFTGVTPGSPLADRNIKIDQVEIYEVSRFGFDPHEQTESLTITNSVAHNNGVDGFVADFLSNSEFSNNIAYENGRHGFNIVTSTHDFNFENNVAYDNGVNGLSIQRGSEERSWVQNISVTNNVLHSNGEAGMVVKLSEYVDIENNTIYYNGTHGIMVSGSQYVDIENNVIYGNSQSEANKHDDIAIRYFNDTDGASGLIYVSHHNTITNNILVSESASEATVRHNINEYDDGSGYNLIADNITGNSVRSNIKISSEFTEFVTDNSSSVQLTNGSDYLQTSALDSYIYTLGGNDTIQGNSGDDIFSTGSGNDSVYSASGQDVIYGGSGNDHIRSGNGNDTIAGEGGNDTISGGRDNDMIFGDSGSDMIYGNSGDDHIEGGSSGDFISGGSGDDVLNGDEGQDTINGGSGHDVLLGGSNSDVISGSSGHDVLIGGSGNDELSGGSGSDIFIFDNLSGRDMITDFRTQDSIHLINSSIETTEELFSLMEDTDEGVFIRLDENTDITLAGITIADLIEDQFSLS